MIWFDVTKSGQAGHRSGLNRVAERLRAALGDAARPVRWPEWRGEGATREDWWLTAELFSEEERPGLTAFLRQRTVRTAAIFHDAIPLRHPTITWPQSVARHPGYLKLLAQFDRVWAVSAASRDELQGFWRWQGIVRPPPVDLVANGADFDGAPRVTAPVPAPPPRLICVGILEPRKNQAFLLEVCTQLWDEGLVFELHVIGRVNPHFGRPIAARLRQARKRYPGLRYHAAADDAKVAALYASARAAVFPTIAEGSGLPLVESLWRGVPCVCSDLPVLRENADGGGCVPVAVNDHAAWVTALRRLLTDDAEHARRQREAVTRDLPTWAGAAATLLRGLSA